MSYDDELDIDNFDVPILSINDPHIKRANKGFKKLISAIELMQLTIKEIKYRPMAHQYHTDVEDHTTDNRE